MNPRICVVSDAIAQPFDEGVKLFVFHLIKELSKNNMVLALSRSNDYNGEIEAYCRRGIPANKLYVSYHLYRQIKEFQPDIIYYIPVACATFFSFLRGKILKGYGNRAKVVIITLQPREYSAASKKVIPFLLPDLVLVQSKETQAALHALGCQAEVISAGVDMEKFRPTSGRGKEKLREKYGLPLNKYIVLHVGHINRNRNAQSLKDIQRIDGVQAVIVGSTSTPQDGDLAEELSENGVVVVTEYIKNIEEIYQCADCYLFPVFSASACIEIPLSVFEAMACNLPVVTARFGALPSLIQEQEGLAYVDSPEEIVNKVKGIKEVPHFNTREMATEFSWGNVASRILKVTEKRIQGE